MIDGGRGSGEPLGIGTLQVSKLNVVPCTMPGIGGLSLEFVVNNLYDLSTFLTFSSLCFLVCKMGLLRPLLRNLAGLSKKMNTKEPGTLWVLNTCPLCPDKYLVLTLSF